MSPICEQMEDPRQTKKIVRREVTRVLSPGTVADNSLGAGENNYLAAVYTAHSSHGLIAALALLDLSTGEFRAGEWSGEFALAQCVDELANSGAAEVLLPAANPLLHTHEAALAVLEQVRTKTPLEDWVFTADYAVPLLERQLGARSLDGFGLAAIPPPPSPRALCCITRRAHSARHWNTSTRCAFLNGMPACSWTRFRYETWSW